jgi:hypothetical protein
MESGARPAGQPIGRREVLLGGAAATATAGLAGVASKTAEADGAGGCFFPSGPAPDPIPGGLDISGFGQPAPYDGVIHIFIPGPEGLVLPFTQTPAQGRNTEPAVITNFDGDTAIGLLVGTARGSDGAEYGVEIDVRVSEGTYKVDDRRRRGLFALF